MSETFPIDWQEQPCFIVAIPQPLVPYVGGLMKIMESRGFWASDGDFQRAYAATLQFEACLMATCLQDLIDLHKAQYRMLNTALFGQVYTSTGDPLNPVSPDIASFVTVDFTDQNSLLGRIDRLVKLTDNSINGAANDLYTATPSVKDLIQSAIDAINASGGDDDDILAQLETIALLLG